MPIARSLPSSPLLHRLRSPRLAVATLALTAGLGCLPATNPCDPAADPQIRRTASLSGTVVDQRGAPVPGVPVFVPGAGGSEVSDGEGRFTFDELLPNDDGGSYEVIAAPQAPLAGGRVVAPSLGCRESRDDLLVPVVVPPPSPEVEISQATAPDRLFVAFAASDGQTVALDDDGLDAALAGCNLTSDALTYRVEVRAPFGVWHEAVLAGAPLKTDAVAAVVDAPLLDADISDAPKSTVDDRCARATCGFYTYAYASLAENENARCAEVVGVKTSDGTVMPLDAYERYEVRVRAEVHVEDATARALPSTVLSAASSSPAELSLTPTAVLPVPLHPDPAVDVILKAELDVTSAAPVNRDRFAIVSGESLLVIGGGTLASDEIEDVMGMEPVTEGGMIVDDETTSMAEDEVGADNGAAIALLPAGKWVRVWKRRLADSMIDKVFIGAYPGDTPAAGAGQEPIFDVNMLFPGAAESFRGFRWLARPEGSLTGGPYNPPDAYLLLFEKGVVILERVASDATDDGLMSEADADSMTSFYPTVADGSPSLCNAVNDIGVIEGTTGTTYGACWDLRTVSDDVALTDVQILTVAADASSPAETFHIFANQAGGEVFVVKSEHLLMKNVPASASSLVDVTSSVRVGLAPSALLPTELLDCANGTKRAVMLVANKGSQDVSVLSVEGTGQSASDVEETVVVPLPAVPVRFLPDPVGPTCDDPYVWVVGDDGRTFPVDLRIDRLAIPSCGEAPCAVETRSRAQTGAVGRNESGRSRVLLGGQGELSEVGYLRPARHPTLAPRRID